MGARRHRSASTIFASWQGRLGESNQCELFSEIAITAEALEDLMSAVVIARKVITLCTGCFAALNLEVIMIVRIVRSENLIV